MPDVLKLEESSGSQNSLSDESVKDIDEEKIDMVIPLIKPKTEPEVDEVSGDRSRSPSPDLTPTTGLFFSQKSTIGKKHTLR